LRMDRGVKSDSDSGCFFLQWRDEGVMKSDFIPWT